MNNEEKKSMGAHNLILEERGSLTVTGVEDIDSFDDQTVVIYTGLGELTVRGNQLHIERIDLQAGELELQGRCADLRRPTCGERRIFCEDLPIDDDRYHHRKGNPAVSAFVGGGSRDVFSV